MVDKKISELDLTVTISGLDRFAVATDIPGTPETEAITFANLLSSAEPTLEAAFTGKKTLYIPGNAIAPTTVSGCAPATQTQTSVNRPEIVHLAFDGTNVENAFFSTSFPKSWDEGTVTFQAYWTGLVAGAGGVSWKVSSVAVSNDDTLDVDYGTPIEVVDTFIAAEDLHISVESDPITIAGSPAQGDLINFNIQRDPADGDDTRSQDANLIGIKMFYIIDSLTDD